MLVYILILFSETVHKDCLEAVQQETEFSYLANFVDSSLLVIQEHEKGFLLNYINDTCLN